MKPKRLLFIVFLCSCICISWLYGYERSELIEPKTNIIFRISKGEAFMKAIKDSPYGKLWNSPEMKPFLNNQSLEDTLIKSIFLNQAKSPVTEEAVDLNRKILSIFEGEVIFGVELGKTGEDDKIFGLAEMGEVDYKKLLELVKLENKSTGKKSIFHRHTFQEVELIQEITTGDDDKDEKIYWMAFYGDTFIETTNRQWAEQCIVHLKKELPAKPFGPPSLQIWLPDGFVNHIMKAKPENGGPTGTAATFRALGLDTLGKLSLEWRMTPIGSEIHLHVRNKGKKRGLWTLLSREPLPRNLFLGYVPENALSYQVIRLNIPAFWEEIPAMLETFGPEVSARFKMGLTITSQMLQVDIERDIVANLDTVLTSYSQLEEIQDETLYAIQLRNSRAMEKTLGKLFAEGAWLRMMMKDNFELLDLQEHKVYSFKIPKYQMPSNKNQTSPENLPEIKLATSGISVVNGDLVFGPLNLIRSFIHGSRNNRAGQKFYQSPLFTRMIRRVPDNAVGYGFADVTQWIKPVVNYFKTIGQKSENRSLLDENTETKNEGKRKPGKKPKSDPFDHYLKNLRYDRLPPLEFLRSFFGPCMGYYQFNGKELVVKWEFHNPFKTQ